LVANDLQNVHVPTMPSISILSTQLNVWFLYLSAFKLDFILIFFQVFLIPRLFFLFQISVFTICLSSTSLCIISARLYHVFVWPCFFWTFLDRFRWFII